MKKLLVLFLSAIVMVSVVAFVGCNRHEHTLKKHEAVVATCENEGNSEYYSCECGKYFEDAEGETEIEKDSWVIPMLAHTLEKHDAVVATCANEGNSEYYSCECGKYFEDAEGETEIEKDSWVIPMLAHTLEKHDAVLATCTNEGNSEYYSCVCGKYFEDAEGKTEIEKDSWISPALPHVLEKHDAVAQACGVEGNSEYYSCECGKYFEDAEGKNEIEEGSWISPALIHIYGDKAKCLWNCGSVLTDDEMVELGYVAKIDGKYYKTLDDALTAGGIIELICDFDEDALTINSGTFAKDPSKWVAEGYIALLNEDGAWSVVKYYEVSTTSELTTAIGKGGYVKLTDSVSLRTQLTISKETTIDLNGNTLTTTQGAYNKILMIKNNLDIISSSEGAKIELGDAGLMQISSDYPNSIVNLENLTINRTATSGTDLILNYGSLNLKNVEINLAGGSMGVFETYGDLTLGEGTVINIGGVLGTSMIDNNGAVNILIDGATINIDSFKVNGGALFSRNKATSFIVNDINLTIVLDETYSSKFLNFVEGTNEDGSPLVQLIDGTYNVTGASGSYYVNAEGKWQLN